jgi:hypothetical protein
MSLNGQPDTALGGIAHDLTEQISAITVFNLAIEAPITGNNLQTKTLHKIVDCHGTFSILHQALLCK